MILFFYINSYYDGNDRNDNNGNNNDNDPNHNKLVVNDYFNILSVFSLNRNPPEEKLG
jgi:hypothetical protein